MITAHVELNDYIVAVAVVHPVCVCVCVCMCVCARVCACVCVHAFVCRHAEAWSFGSHLGWPSKVIRRHSCSDH